MEILEKYYIPLLNFHLFSVDIPEDTAAELDSFITGLVRKWNKTDTVPISKVYRLIQGYAGIHRIFSDDNVRQMLLRNVSSNEILEEALFLWKTSPNLRIALRKMKKFVMKDQCIDLDLLLQDLEEYWYHYTH